MSSFASSAFSVGGFSPAAFAFDVEQQTQAPGGGGFGYGYGLSRKYRTEDEIRKERIRLGILPPEVEQAVTKAVETAVAKREEPDEAIDLQAAENALRADLARMDRQITDAVRRLLYLEYARQEMEFEEAQIVMLLFDM